MQTCVADGREPRPLTGRCPPAPQSVHGRKCHTLCEGETASQCHAVLTLLVIRIFPERKFSDVMVK